MNPSPRPSADALWADALEVIAGGVSSPARSFKGVGGGAPVFIARGQGAHVWDAGGRRYLDYVAAYGPLILGHAPPEVVAALRACLDQGWLFGAPSEPETRLAQRLQEAVPALDLVRFTSTGTEAVMAAIRLARAATGRPKLVKMAGHYHGHADAVLPEAGSGVATVGLSASGSARAPANGVTPGGIPAGVARDVFTVPYNATEPLADLLRRRGDEVAAVLMEPVCGNMGLVPPKPGYLEAVRELTARHGAVLVFDEVITAFRYGYGAAFDRYGVTPDLVCLGKIIGGGLPLGAYGGRRDLMERMAPAGPVFQAGTHAGNGLTMAAGLATLDRLARPGTYDALDVLAGRLADGLEEAAREAGVPVCLNRVGSQFSVFFTGEPVEDYAAAARADRGRFARFFHQLLDRGVFLPPSPFETWFVSTAHTDADVNATLDAARAAFRAVR